MKAIFRILFSALALLMIVPLTQCGEDEPEPKPRDLLYDKVWYNNQGLGDYKFKSDKTYEYYTPWGTTVNGSYMWYNDLVDSMKVVQAGGGNWTIWFRTITEQQFTMSQSNENHTNVYTYTITDMK
jgi:hypothetical protein